MTTLDALVAAAVEVVEDEAPMTTRMREHLAARLRERFAAVLAQEPGPAWSPEAPTVTRPVG